MHSIARALVALSTAAVLAAGLMVNPASAAASSVSTGDTANPVAKPIAPGGSGRRTLDRPSRWWEKRCKRLDHGILDPGNIRVCVAVGYRNRPRRGVVVEDMRMSGTCGLLDEPVAFRDLYIDTVRGQRSAGGGYQGHGPCRARRDVRIVVTQKSARMDVQIGKVLAYQWPDYRNVGFRFRVWRR